MDLSENAVKVLEKRYLERDEKGRLAEDPEGMMKRVAAAIAKADEEYVSKEELEIIQKDFFHMMYNLEFLPNSPTLMNAGRPLGQLSACFVLPVEDTMEGIFESIKNSALIHKSGGGTGFSFSRIRPKGSSVNSTGGVASGPISFMKVFNSATEAVKQGGTRRGANMGILRVDHPDIMEFITCKKDNSEITNFNISVGITEEFMKAVEKDEDYSLYDPHIKKSVARLNARKVFNLIVDMSWKNGEPGIIFLDRLNRDNVTPELGDIESTNPCFHPDTLILTSEGLISVKELYEKYSKGQEFEIAVDNRVSGQKVIKNQGSFYENGISFKKARVFKTGNKQTVKVSLKNGQEIKVTPDHRIMTPDGWKEAAKLTCNDYVLIRSGAGIFAKSDEIGGDMSQVQGVEEAETVEVYDINEPVTNSLIAQGMVVHNCGEQPLLPYEACNLGSINLGIMVKPSSDQEGKLEVDYSRISDVTRKAVHFLDNVIDVNKYPLPEIDKMTRGTRKIGLGVMGWADLLCRLEIPYDSENAIMLAEKIMKFISEESKRASMDIAEKKGEFPYLEKSIFYDRGIKIRNATTTTIAPTGTISIIAGASSGIEPIFAISYIRNIMDNNEMAEVNPLFKEVAKRKGFYSDELMIKIAKKGSIQGFEEIPRKVQEVFVTSHDISPKWHVRMQAAFQKYTDNAVSKTVNLPNEATREDVKAVFLQAYRENCKGVTLYRDGSRDMQVLNIGEVKGREKETGEGSESTPVSKSIAPRPRPDITTGFTEKVKIGCGNLYITVNYDEQGICEVFTNTGRAGGCPSQSEATSRLVSIALRSGLDVKSIVEQLKGIRCPSTIRQRGLNVLSCPDAIGRLIEKVANLQNGKNENNVSVEEISKGSENLEIGSKTGGCPECGMALEHEGGCVVCRSCGYSKCG